MSETQTVTFGLHVGALADPIIKQVKAQGFDLDRENAKHFQRDVEVCSSRAVRQRPPGGITNAFLRPTMTRKGA